SSFGMRGTCGRSKKVQTGSGRNQDRDRRDGNEGALAHGNQELQRNLGTASASSAAFLPESSRSTRARLDRARQLFLDEKADRARHRRPGEIVTGDARGSATRVYSRSGR